MSSGMVTVEHCIHLVALTSIEHVLQELKRLKKTQTGHINLLADGMSRSSSLNKLCDFPC